MLLWVCILIFAGSFLLTILCERVAKRYRIVSKPSYRRKLDEATPLLGGVAVFVATSMGLLYIDSDYGLLMVTAFLPMLIVGILDDAIELDGRWKFGAQLVSSALWLTLLPKDQMLFGHLLTHHWLSQVVALVFIVGTTNAYNFLDGMDGEASTLAIIGWLAIAATFPFSDLALVMAAAQSGFLLRNWHPARTYLGEVGGAYVGFSLGAIATVAPQQTVDMSYFMAILFLFSLPFSDVVAAIVRRVLSGKSIFFADREHVHHRLLKLHFSVTQALAVISIIAVGGAMTFVLASKTEAISHRWLLYALSGLLLVTIFGGVFFSEGMFSKRVMSMSKSLLRKYFADLEAPLAVIQPTRAALLDLLPYYREIQLHGVLVVDQFIQEIAGTVKSWKGVKGVGYIGSYSIVLFYSGTKTWSVAEQTEIAQDFHSLFKKFNCLRSQATIPEGLSFYNHANLEGILVRISHDEDQQWQSAS